MIFVDGTGEARERAREHVPTATFTTAGELLAALADA